MWNARSTLAPATAQERYAFLAAYVPVTVAAEYACCVCGRRDGVCGAAARARPSLQVPHIVHDVLLATEAWPCPIPTEATSLLPPPGHGSVQLSSMDAARIFLTNFGIAADAANSYAANSYAADTHTLKPNLPHPRVPTEIYASRDEVCTCAHTDGFLCFCTCGDGVRSGGGEGGGGEGSGGEDDELSALWEAAWGHSGAAPLILDETELSWPWL